MHVLRTSKLFRCDVSMSVGPGRIRGFSEDDARQLAERLRKRNVFSRHAADRDFYTAKAAGFANETVVEFMLSTGDATVVREMAERVERFAFVAATLWIDRAELHRTLGATDRGAGVQDLVVESSSRLSAKTRRPSSTGRLVLDAGFEKRFGNHGFPKTADGVVSAADYIGKKVDGALRWLFQSRLEHDAEAAYVKTVIGLETMFVLDQNEAPRQTIADRVAFLLGRDPEQRQRIAKATRDLYDRRSSIVHGGRKAVRVRDKDVDAAERLLLLAAHGLAFQAGNIKDADAHRGLFSDLKWGTKSQPPLLPFPAGDVSRLLKRVESARA